MPDEPKAPLPPPAHIPSAPSAQAARGIEHAGPAEHAEHVVELRNGWESLVRDWARRRGESVAREDGALYLETTVGGPTGPRLTVDVSRAAGSLVVAVTDGTLVSPDRLAPTAAAATAWNSREVTPTAILGDERSETPLLSAVLALPLAAHLSADGFATTLDTLLDAALRLLRECHDLGFVLRSTDDLTTRE
ncbi:YbjN domain-containing protein [Streptomyces zaomyceticus]|uniref:YbjN domain-containing protein n=1 Tax=Streptomyces zaomyceticus TaxID=68286 RepID=UPI0034307EFA